MSDIRPERLTVPRDEGFVVLLIGARVNSFWKLPLALAVGGAMSRMLRELEADPDSGLLSWEQSFSLRTTSLVQYWRSPEDVWRFAKDGGRSHIPAWRQWVKKWSTGAVGIFHEMYVVEPGSYECVYHHMPPYGLGKVGPLVAAEGDLKTSKKRLERPRRMPLAA